MCFCLFETLDDGFVLLFVQFVNMLVLFINVHRDDRRFWLYSGYICEFNPIGLWFTKQTLFRCSFYLLLVKS